MVHHPGKQFDSLLEIYTCNYHFFFLKWGIFFADVISSLYWFMKYSRMFNCYNADAINFTIIQRYYLNNLYPDGERVSCSVVFHSLWPPVPLVHGILQARRLEWVAIPFSRGTSQPRDWAQVSCIADSLYYMSYNTCNAK